MGANITQLADGSASFDTNYPGAAANNVGFIPVSFSYTAASVDAFMFVASRAYIIKAVRLRVNAAGSDGSAVTVQVRNVPPGTALVSGSAVLSSALDLKTAANSIATGALSLSPTDLMIPPGNTLAVDFTGTLTAATGVITVELALV